MTEKIYKFCMRCTYCGVDQTRAVDTRPIKNKDQVRRRRECLNCGRRFTTYEKVMVKVVTK